MFGSKVENRQGDGLERLKDVVRDFIIKQYIYQAYRQPCVVDARDKTRLFLDFFLEPEGTVKFQSSKVRLKKGYESGLHF